MNVAQRALVVWANRSGTCVGRRKSLAALMQRILGAVAVSDGAVWLRFRCKTNAEAQCGQFTHWSGFNWSSGLQVTRSVFAAATDFHYMRFVSFFTVFAAMLTSLFGRTVARAMLTLVRCFVSHYFTSTNERDQFSGDGFMVGR